MPRLHARGSDGVVCIHTGSDDVVDDPLIDLSRVMFHSDLDYPAIVATHVVSVTLPARGAITYATHVLAAHGRASAPWVLGYISNMSNVALAGSVPVDAVTNSWFGRFVTLGADDTHIVLHEHTTAALSSRTLDLVILETDLLPDATPPTPTNESIYLGTDEIRASGGKFRTTKRYIRATSSGDFAIAKGQTIDWAVDGGPIVRFRYSVDGYVVQPFGGSTSFNAVTQDVTT